MNTKEHSMVVQFLLHLAQQEQSDKEKLNSSSETDNSEYMKEFLSKQIIIMNSCIERAKEMYESNKLEKNMIQHIEVS
jgi:hypothetical protein